MQARSNAIIFPTVSAALILFYLLANCIPYFGYDSACFYYEAVRLAKGDSPFLQFVDNKNPGIIFFQLIPALLFGFDPSAAVLLARLTEIGITVCLLFMLRHLQIGKESSSLAVVAFWTTYIALFAGTNETLYTETLQTFCMLLAWCAVMILNARATGGFLMACAILSRQTAVLGLAALLLFDLTLGWRTGVPIKGMSARMLRTAGVCIVTIGAVAGWAAYQGWLGAWWYYAYEWSWVYMNGFGSPEGRLVETFSHLFTNSFTIWWGVAFLIWCYFLVIDLLHNRSAYLAHHLFIFLGFALGLVETSLSGILLRHHFIPWLPPLAIMLGFGCQRVLTWGKERNVRWAPIGLAGVFFGLLIPTTLSNMTALYARTQFNQDRALSEYLGRWIKARTGVDQAIYVWGFTPQIYLTSERRAASKHFHHLLVTNVRERFTPRNDGLIEDFRNDIRNSRPGIIMDMEAPSIDGYLGDIMNMYSRKMLDTPYGSVSYLQLRTSGEVN